MLPSAVYALLILLIFVGIAFGRVPGLRMNRATIAVVGAALLLVSGALTEEEAFEAIDLGTLVLLFSMMILNSALQMAGFFDWVGSGVLRLARSPHMLLALVIAASGVLSALFLNDPICVMFTPLVVDVTLRARRNPLPYLMGLATGANVGSTATITGNPQNLLIGQASGIPYLTFAANLAPIAVLGLVVCWLVIVLLYPAEFRAPLSAPELAAPAIRRGLLVQSLLVTAGLLAAFLLGAPIASAAFVGAGLMLITRIEPERLLRVDWELLVFFSGLFIVTGALQTTGLSERLFDAIRPVIGGGVAPLSLATAGLSNLVSNVPAVLLFRPIVLSLPDPQQAWLTLAMSSTLAGNLTLLGSVANLIVAETAARRGVQLSFGEYLRAGIPITVLTLLIGIFWLSLAG
jgi:Na+/H+ antiporter NhaD/arsenite permease-like protein